MNGFLWSRKGKPKGVFLDSLWLNISRLSAPQTTCKSSFCAHVRGVRLYYSDPCNTRRFAPAFVGRRVNAHFALRKNDTCLFKKIAMGLLSHFRLFCYSCYSTCSSRYTSCSFCPTTKSSSFHPPVSESGTSAAASQMRPLTAVSNILDPNKLDKDDGVVGNIFLPFVLFLTKIGFSRNLQNPMESKCSLSRFHFLFYGFLLFQFYQTDCLFCDFTPLSCFFLPLMITQAAHNYNLWLLCCRENYCKPRNK